VRWKWLVLLLVVAVGSAAFALRFHHYFTAGAASVDARLDYWHAAVRNTIEHPLLGSGPGTFQRPYAQLKLPGSEMARLAHNDYLEQFSDSGVLAGVSYVAWIGLLLGTIARRTLLVSTPTSFAISVGLLGWFAQGLSEFGLYIPALAWTAFALAGGVLRLSAHQEQS
jgi:O-antigen ligase